jgi:hypothetical protein
MYGAWSLPAPSVASGPSLCSALEFWPQSQLGLGRSPPDPERSASGLQIPREDLGSVVGSLQARYGVAAALSSAQVGA